MHEFLTITQYFAIKNPLQYYILHKILYFYFHFVILSQPAQ